jgi:DHA1 family tetracycline resistance protein-like MFS transporter
MRQSSLLIIFLVVFIDLVGFGIVIPILPYYAKTYGASGWSLGWLMTSYSLMQFIFAPLWGKISDHVGRRPVLLISILGTSLSMTILGLSNSLEWLFIGRIFAGVCGANISTAYAYVTDVTSDEDRAKGMGLVGAGFGLGFIFGRAFGGLLSRYGYALPRCAGAALAAINLAFAFFKLEEPRLSAEARSSNRYKRFDLSAIRGALEDSRTRFAVGIFLLLTFAVTQMEVTFALFMSNRYGLGAEAAGVLLAIMGVVMVVVQGGLIGRLVRRFGELKLVIAGTAIAAVALVCFASTGSLTVVVLSLVLLAFGHGMLHPSLSSLASMGANARRRGMTMGVFQSAGSLARVLGPPCAGWLFDRMSWRSPFYAGAVILGLCFILSLLWSLRRPEPAESF